MNPRLWLRSWSNFLTDKSLKLEPAKTTEPALGLSKPPKRCSKVLLPEPEEPTMATFSDVETSKSMALSTSTALTP